MTEPREPLTEIDLLSRCVVVEACWEWTGNTTNGYGMVKSHRGRAITAHRAMYEIMIGPIPSDCNIDHLCRNRRCINPAHLEAVSPTVNILRGYGPPAMNARKSACHNGHALSGNNLVVERDGRRRCRTCQRERNRGYRELRRM